MLDDKIATKAGPTGSGLGADVSIEDIRSWWKVPAIAHFCSLFRATFTLPDYEIEDLEEALFLDAGQESTSFLAELLVALLRGCFSRKDITILNYHKYLRDFMKQHWELVEGRVNPLNLEEATFKALPTLTKVEILHSLCDFRLDAADISVLKEYHGEQLRVEPLGTDSKGAKYWYFYSTRLYKEDPAPTPEEKEAKRKKKEKEKKKKKKESEAARKKRLQETVKARKALEKQLAKKKPTKMRKLLKPLKPPRSDNETCSDDNIPLTQLRKKKAGEKQEVKNQARGKTKRKMEEEKVEEPEVLNENGKRKKAMPQKRNAKKVKKEEVKKEEQGSDADSESEEDDSPKGKKKKKEKKTRKTVKKEELETETECEAEEEDKKKKVGSPRGKGRKVKEEVSAETEEESEVGGAKAKKVKGKKGKAASGKRKIKEETATSAESEMEVAEGKAGKGKGVQKKKGKKGKKGDDSQEDTDVDQWKGKKARRGKGKKNLDTATESEGMDKEEEKGTKKGKGGGAVKKTKGKLKKESSVEMQSGSEVERKKGKKTRVKKRVGKAEMSQDESQDEEGAKVKVKKEVKTEEESEKGPDKKKRRKKKEIKSKEIITETETDTELDEEVAKGDQKKGKATGTSGRVTRRGTPPKVNKCPTKKAEEEGKGTAAQSKAKKKIVKGKPQKSAYSKDDDEEDEEEEVEEAKAKMKKGGKGGQKVAKATAKKNSKKSGKASSQESQDDGAETQEEAGTLNTKGSKKTGKAGQTTKGLKGSQSNKKTSKPSGKKTANEDNHSEDSANEKSTSQKKKGRATTPAKKPASKAMPKTPVRTSSKTTAAQQQKEPDDEQEALKELQALLLLENMLKLESGESSDESSSSDDEPEGGRWHLVCHTVEDWQQLAQSFKKARNKRDRELYLVLVEDFIPEIHNIFAAKERALRRKLQEMVPRRSSGRIADLKVRQEEEERQKSLQEIEDAQKEEKEEAARKICLRRRNRRQGEYAENDEEEEEEEEVDEEEEDEAEEDEGNEEDGEEEEEGEEDEEKTAEKQAAEKALQQEKERSMRVRLRAKNKSPEPSSDDPTSSSSVPYDLGFGRTTRSSRSQVQQEQEKEKLKKSFAKILETTKTHPEAWPFIDPVQESYAPNYYSIIKAPMDIATMDLKVEERMYHSINDFVNDMDVIFQNCVQYNGRKSEYTLMARKVEACFRRALKKEFPTFRKKNANCRHPVPKPVFTDSQDEGETDSQSSRDNRVLMAKRKPVKKKTESDKDEEDEDTIVESSPDLSPCPSPASYHSEDYVELTSCKTTHPKRAKRWKPKEEDEDGDDEQEDDDDDEVEKRSLDGREAESKMTKEPALPSSKEELILSEEEESEKVDKKKDEAPKDVEVNAAASGPVIAPEPDAVVDKTVAAPDIRPAQPYVQAPSLRYMENADKPRAHVPPMVGTPLRQSSLTNNPINQSKPLQVSESPEDRNRLSNAKSSEERSAQFSPTSKPARDLAQPVSQNATVQPLSSGRSVDKTMYSGDQLLHKGLVHHGIVQGPEPMAVQPVVERNTAVQANPNHGSYQEMIDLNARRPPPPLQTQWYNPQSEQSNKSSGATQAVPPLMQEGPRPSTQGSSLQQPLVAQPTADTEHRTQSIPMHPPSNLPQGHVQSHPHGHPQSHSHPQSHLHSYPVHQGMVGHHHNPGAPAPAPAPASAPAPGPDPWGMASREMEPSPAKLWRPQGIDVPSTGTQGHTSLLHKAHSPPQYPLQAPPSQPNAPPPPQTEQQQQPTPMSESLQRLASQGSPNAHHGTSTTATELLRSMASPTHTEGAPPRPLDSSGQPPPSAQPKPLTTTEAAPPRPGSSFRVPSQNPMPNSTIPPGYPGYSGMPTTQRVPTPGLSPHLGLSPAPGLDPNTYPGYSGQMLPARKDLPYDPMRTGHTSPFPTTATASPKPDIFNPAGRLTPSAGLHASLSAHRSSAFNQPHTALYASQLHHPVPASQTLPSSYPGLSTPSHLRTLLQGRQGPIPDPLGRVGQPDMLQRNPYLDQAAYGPTGVAPGLDPRYAPSMYSQQYNHSMPQQPVGPGMSYQMGTSNSYFTGQPSHPQSYHSLNPSHVPPGYRR